jgi:hypothetical protein
LLFIFGGIAAVVNGQAPPVNLYTTVGIPAETMRFDSLLRLAGKQGGIRFSLNTKKFQPSTIIRIKKGRQSIAALLAAIQANTGIYYRILGDHIIFVDNPLPKKLPKPSLRQESSVVKKPVAVLRDSIARNTPAALVSRQPALPLSNIMAMPPHKTAGAVIKNSLLRRAGSLSQDMASSSGDKRARQGHSFTMGKLFINTGMAVDETLYVNPTLQAGFPFFYGILSWSTNFKVSGIRYGAGGSIRLSDDWRLHLTATTGNMGKNIGDTMRHALTLYRGALLLEKQWGDHLRMQAGPLFNLLKTTYYLRGEPSAAAMFIARFNENEYSYIKPLYTLGNTWSYAGAGNTKMWIGLQVSLFYNLQFGSGN